MISTRLRSLALALILPSAVGAAGDPLAAVRVADDDRVAATIAADRTRLDAIYSPALHRVHSGGKVDDKAGHLKGVVNRDGAFEKFDYRTRDSVLAAPGVVIMKGRVVIHSHNSKGKSQNDVDFPAVWREENARRRLLAWQAAKSPLVALGK